MRFFTPEKTVGFSFDTVKMGRRHKTDFNGDMVFGPIKSESLKGVKNNVYLYIWNSTVVLLRHKKEERGKMRIMVLNDDETYTSLEGCTIHEIPDEWEESDIEGYLRDYSHRVAIYDDVPAKAITFFAKPNQQRVEREKNG